MFSNGNFLIILLVLNQTSLILLSIAEPSTNSSLLFINKERNQQNFSYLQQENKQDQQQQQLKLKQYQKYSNYKNDIKKSNLSSTTANTTATTTNSPILLSSSISLSSTFSSLSPSLSSSTTTTTTTTDKREIINKVFSKNILKENHNNNNSNFNNNNKNVINNIQHTNTTRKSTTTTISPSTVKQQKYNDDDISVEKTIEDLSSIETLSFEKRGDSKSKLSKLSLESVPLPSLTSSSNSESSSSSLPSELPGSSIKLSRQLHHQDRKLLRNQQLPSPQLSNINELPIFPERSDAVYFIVAIMGGAKTWSRIMARTLLEMGPPFGSPMGPPLRPLYVDLPASGGFSAKVLTSLCQQIENIPLAGVVVIGDGQSARAIALSGNAMQVPVLWARGGTANIHGIQREAQSALQSMLQPSAREILKAIRALFLQTHWHSFFVLADVDAAMVLAGNDGRTLKDPPLLPTILPLPAGDGDVFRQLAIISRSTRGIVLLLCNLISARKIMSEAKRLNMAGGHYIWLWADTSSTTEFFDLNHHKSTTLDETMLEYPEAVKEFTVVSSSSSSIPLSVSSSSSSSSQSSSSSSSNLYRQSIPSSSSISSPSSTILSSSEVSPLPDYDEDNISNMKNKNFHHKINNIGINGMNLNGDGISNENGFYNGDIKPKSFDESIDVVKGTTTGSTINFFNNIDKEKEVINMKKQKQHESRKNIQRQGETQRLPFQQNRFESKKFQQDSYEDADDAIATATVTTTSNKDYNTGEKDIIEEENDNTENIDDDVNDEKNLSSNGNDDDDNDDENLKKRQGYSQGPGRYVIGLYDDDNIDMSLELKKNKANRRYRQHTDDYYIDDDNNKDRMIQSKSDSNSNSYFNINNNNKNRNSNSKISDKYYPTENPYLSLKNYNSMEMNENFDQYDDDDDDLIDTSMEEWFELPGNNWAQINNDTTSNLSPTILDNIDETSDLKLSYDSVENKNINNNQNDNNNNNKNINDNSNNNSGATPISNSNNKKIKNINNNNNSNNSNNNNNNNSNQKLKPKRTSFSEASHYIKNLTRSSDVLFHYFKDFPVGLLALRPVKMPVDRNFVRSTIRLFASTWARITFDNNLHNNINLSINNYQKNYINNINKNQNFRQYGTNIYDNYNWFASVNSRELIRDRLRNFFHTEYKRKRLRRNILIRSNFIKFNNLNSNHINNNNNNNNKQIINNNYNSNNNNHYSNNNNKNRYIREINFNEIETVNKTINNNNNNNKKNIKNNDNDENLNKRCCI
ncbi:putative uncharacterized protein DDB_G0277255 [Condylostylus longicornis]|uniref:putative uncharacterized protein DDB_G0277255 n=1 Tax=Condylostylus longicornis TaxID=2530218 RepID=UPI00244DC0D3|nr:putative uncharacterized protein DDB_G0277255 [Condylostylus longicornis]